MDHAADVADGDVLALQPHRHQQVEAGERGRAAAGVHQAHILDSLALQQQPVAHRGGDDDGGAVLVVVEHRDAHARAQRALDDEALRCLDVLEVDRAEGRLQRGHHLDELRGVAFVDLDVDGIDAGELLEQHRLAFHHRLGGERADGPQAQHGGAVGDDGDHVAAGRVVPGAGGVGGDLLAGGGYARAVGKAKVALRRHALGRFERQFPRARKTVVVECCAPEIFVHRVTSGTEARGFRTIASGAAARRAAMTVRLATRPSPAAGCSPGIRPVLF